MSLLSPSFGLPYWHAQALALGVKYALDQQTPEPPQVAYNLSGLLYVTDHGGKPWGLLSVPNALVRGVFDAMHEPGIELPLSGGKLDAHITVFRPEEIERLGGPEALRNDRGKPFGYSLGRLVSVEPAGWPEMARCWMVRVHSPQLQQLRRSHGLSSLPNEGKYDFHITVGVRRRGVLNRSTTAKNTTAA